MIRVYCSWTEGACSTCTYEYCTGKVSVLSTYVLYSVIQVLSTSILSTRILSRNTLQVSTVKMTSRYSVATTDVLVVATSTSTVDLLYWVLSTQTCTGKEMYIKCTESITYIILQR